MANAKHIGCMWALAVALGVGLAVASTPAVASADSGKGSSGDSSQSSHPPGGKKGASSASTDAPKPHLRAPKPKRDSSTSEQAPKPKQSPATTLSVVQVRSTPPPPRTPNPAEPVSSAVSTLMGLGRREVGAAAAADSDFVTSTHGFFGLFSVTSAADPDDNHYVAFVIRTPFFTNVLTSGTDPEDNLGFGAASIGLAGHTVNTFSSPFLNFSIGIPVEDPFAPLFTELVRAGF